MQAKALWITIHLYASPSCQAPFPSIRTMAKQMRVSRNSVYAWLKELIDQRFVIKINRKSKQGDFTSSIYIHFDDPSQATDERVEALVAECENNGSLTEGCSNFEQGWVKICTTPGSNSAPPVVQNLHHPAARTSGQSVEKKGTTKSPENLSRSNRSRSNTNKTAAKPPPDGDVHFSEGENSAEAADAASGNETEDEELTPSRNITLLSRRLTKGIASVLKIKTRPTFSAQALLDGKEFFSECPLWEWSDVLWVVLNSIVCAKQHPKNSDPFDPWFYSRNFAHLPNKIFSKNSDQEYFILRMAKELNYTLTKGFREEQIVEALHKFFATLKSASS